MNTASIVTGNSVRKQILGQSGIETSALGFGCVKLTTQPSRREALATLEHAFAHGIAHFDVARAYGSGRAEGILGEFLRGKREKVTVATKAGIQPPAGLAGKGWVIGAAKKLLSPFPGLLNRAKQRGSSMTQASVFDPVSVVQSLETSLRELHTDYVDILFLHEAEIADACNAELIAALQSQVTRGTVRCLGMASEISKFKSDAGLLPAIYGVAQFNDNLAAESLTKLAARESRGIITHSIFQPAQALQQAIAERPEVVRKYSAGMNLDLANPTTISSLLLRYALASNAAGVVLFASTSPEHIATNVRETERPLWAASQLAQLRDFAHDILTTEMPGSQARRAAL